jgi:hypothetical protein
MAWKPYKIKTVRPPSPPRPGVGREPAQPGETLSGYIGSFKASDIEERTARALNSRETSFNFRTQFIPSQPPVMISGKSGRDQLGAVEVDFMVQVNGLLTAVQIDGEWAHKNASQRESDRHKDAQMEEILRQSGGGVLVRIPFYYLKTQDMANQTIASLLSGVTDFGSKS